MMQTNNQAILEVNNVSKAYYHGRFHKKRRTFSLEADFRFEKPCVVAVMGANGAGKTTLFEIMTGANPPTTGQVTCLGQNIHNIKYKERDRLAIHYHQSYQVRRLKWTKPAFMMDTAVTDYPVVHLFDEPQFNTQDGYIGFMLDFFKKLRSEGRLIFMSLHPTEQYHLSIVQEICERYMFVYKGKVYHFDTWAGFVADERVREYLGKNLEEYEDVVRSA
jgi:ABC-type multidrug transport system ATPase subunit